VSRVPESTPPLARGFPATARGVAAGRLCRAAATGGFGRDHRCLRRGIATDGLRHEPPSAATPARCCYRRLLPHGARHRRLLPRGAHHLRQLPHGAAIGLRRAPPLGPPAARGCPDVGAVRYNRRALAAKWQYPDRTEQRAVHVSRHARFVVARRVALHITSRAVRGAAGRRPRTVAATVLPAASPGAAPAASPTASPTASPGVPFAAPRPAPPLPAIGAPCP
jgi:hypothetical protein